jgi:hypothetical protein
LTKGTSTQEEQMTGKADFTEEEWKTVLEAPPSAGLIVITASRGGSIRESFSMAKAYGEARKQHGESELLDEVVSAKPKMDHTRYKTPEELKRACMGHVTAAVDLLESKAGPEELDEYKKFILGRAQRVAAAHKEHGEQVSDAEREAIGEIGAALA